MPIYHSLGKNAGGTYKGGTSGDVPPQGLMVGLDVKLRSGLWIVSIKKTISDCGCALEATDWFLILSNVVWCEHWVHVVSCFHSIMRSADPRERGNVKLGKLSKSIPHLCEKYSEKLLSRFIVRGMRSLNPGWILQPRRIQFYCTC